MDRAAAPAAAPAPAAPLTRAARRAARNAAPPLLPRAAVTRLASPLLWRQLVRCERARRLAVEGAATEGATLRADVAAAALNPLQTFASRADAIHAKALACYERHARDRSGGGGGSDAGAGLAAGAARRSARAGVDGAVRRRWRGGAEAEAEGEEGEGGAVHAAKRLQLEREIAAQLLRLTRLQVARFHLRLPAGSHPASSRDPNIARPAPYPDLPARPTPLTLTPSLTPPLIPPLASTSLACCVPMRSSPSRPTSRSRWPRPRSAPCTLHPAPRTPHPAPRTPHPAPAASLHPAPHALHPPHPARVATSTNALTQA